MDASYRVGRRARGHAGDLAAIAALGSKAGLADLGGTIIAYEAWKKATAGEYRINGVVANIPEFARAFSCKPGQPMVREDVCRVW